MYIAVVQVSITTNDGSVTLVLVMGAEDTIWLARHAGESCWEASADRPSKAGDVARDKDGDGSQDSREIRAHVVGVSEACGNLVSII